MSTFSSPERTGSKRLSGKEKTQGVAARKEKLKNELKALNYENGRARLSPDKGGGGTFIHDLFVRINQNKDTGIDRDEVIAHLKRVGIKGGFLGMVHSGVADAFLENLDTNKDEKVTWEEFYGVAATVMPAEIFDAEGKIRPDLIDEVYAKLDTDNSGGVSRKEIEASALANMPEDTSHKGTKAGVAGKLGIDALDFDKSGDITKAELLKAAEDVARIMGSG